MQDTDRYDTENFNTSESNNDEKIDHELENVQAQGYEIMSPNISVPPPIPKPNTQSKKPNLSALHSTHFIHTSGHQTVHKPTTMAQRHPQCHGRVQQQLQLQSGSPERFYEIPE